ncbi:PAS domain S-box protein [Desulfococcaceae bacterium HSG9]|nr:PAS domain S-box protein [Desulfococcaceae bacterium HSG9]
MKIKYKTLLSISCLILINSFAFGIINYQSQKKSLLDGIDTKLLSAAHFTRAILQPDYHNMITDQYSVSKEKYLGIVDRYNKLCLSLDLQYLWSVIVINEEVVFTSGTSTSKDVNKGKHALFFEVHSDPEVFSTAIETMKPHYSSFHNKWGAGRMVLVPSYDSKGRKVIFGASVSLNKVAESLKSTVIGSIMIGLFFLIIGIGFSFLIAQNFSQQIENISDIAKKIADGELKQKVEVKGGLELASLSISINSMSRAIYEKITQAKNNNQALIHEIKERKHVEKLIKQERERIQNILDITPTMIMALDGKGKISLINRRGCEILGYDDEKEVMGKDWFDNFIPEHSREGVRVVFKRLMDGEIVLYDNVNTYTIIDANGNEIYISWHNALIKNSQGEITGTLSAGIDITEQKRAEEALLESENKYRTLFEVESDALAVIELQTGNILDANKAFVDLYGYSKKEILCMKNTDFSAEPDKTREATKSGKKKILIRYHKNRNGTVFPVEISVGIFKFQGRDCHLAAIRDITDRENMQIYLKESEEKFRTFSEASFDGIAITKKGCILEMNEQFVSMSGYNRDELNGKNVDFMLHPEDRDFVKANVLSGYDLPYEHRAVKKDGSIIYLEVCGKQIQYRSKMCRITAIRDITGHKKAEITLKDQSNKLQIINAELERANRLKDEFLANMSHELRTPLTAVLGMSEALLDQVYGHLNEQQIRSLQTVENSGKHLLNLINDILDMAKISAGKMELEIARVSVDEVCQASLQMIKQIAHKKKQRLSVITDSRVTHIRADMLRLKQMLVNLLTNAVKFTPERGKISLEVNCTPDQDMVEFAIRDTGIGISQEDMKKLFMPFVQLDGGLSRKHEGTGLGLVMVSKLAEIHGGSVSVESEEGGYSRFSIMLPWHPEEAEDLRGIEDLGSPDSESSEGLGRLNQGGLILMADDNISNLETVADYLEAKSYSVLLAYNGSEAVALANEKKPDLIIMDIQMPSMDGMEAIKAIRKRENDEASGTRMIPIIAVTALAMPGDREKCIEAGADEYMSKPVGLKKLAGMIEELLGS